ncbi:MAG: hypothetical protein ACRCUJ_03610 [Phocaeicola sp.]
MYLIDMTEEDYALLSPAHNEYLGSYDGGEGDPVEAALCRWNLVFLNTSESWIHDNDLEWLADSGVPDLSSWCGKYKDCAPLISGAGSFDAVIRTGIIS